MAVFTLASFAIIVLASISARVAPQALSVSDRTPYSHTT